ncbi:hypothetical protein [Novosphingobium beihaiensis]|uniref:Uncharacterized protein n=1 Tax=Novosphingobium beihaiensis TaxID=2930389 RepID=A0ABT0BPY3_9SPHN|nr:hypothetical protein [Novosphingobium beihaiensis]MCJ2187092.1 hypothetical protein [Novosphingobium beihaiensis]
MICNAAKSPAQKRYLRRVLLFTGLYLVTFALQTALTKENDLSVFTRTAFALLPGFCISGVFWAIGRLIVEEQDEFQRMLTVRQAMIASGLAMASASVWGFLEGAAVVPHVDAYWWAVVWFIGLAIGGAVNRVQYGSWGMA